MQKKKNSKNAAKYIHQFRAITMNNYDQCDVMPTNFADCDVGDPCCWFDCSHLFHLWLVDFHCHSIDANAHNNPKYRTKQCVSMADYYCDIQETVQSFRCTSNVKWKIVEICILFKMTTNVKKRWESMIFTFCFV